MSSSYLKQKCWYDLKSFTNRLNSGAYLMKAHWDGKREPPRPTNLPVTNSSITVAWVTLSKYVLQLSNSTQTKVWLFAG
ncbi:hypothetical protein ATANTOWER_031414 [Ataeniobius toweri]|uniref:Uncharacterized protein n=1 Tax=Ataeniobius toweri TaxID=208326 RepID=A0ABU7AC07_9TELE|nr:hypothetical protein [Ataeniobius toweri]